MALDRRTCLLLAILAVAAALRFWAIGGHPLWIDEANGVLTAQESLAGILGKLRTDSSPPLYYFLLHVWMAVFGDSEIAVRSLSVCFSMGLVGLVFLVGARCFSPAVGLMAAFVVAVAPVQIFYSQQARMYTMLSFLAALSTWSLVRSLETRKRTPLVVFAGSTVAALYTHNFAFFLLPLFGLLILLSKQLRERWLTWLIVVIAGVLAYLPWAPTFLEQLRNEDHYAWFQRVWNHWSTVGPVWYSLRSFSPGGSHILISTSDWINWYYVPAGVGLGLMLLGCWALWKERKTRPVLAGLWTPCYLVVPAACSIISSTLMTPNYVAGRVDQAVYPAYALMVALGIGAIRNRVAQAILLVAIGVVGAASALTYHYIPSRLGKVVPGEREIVDVLAQRAGPKDAVLFTSLSRAPIEYLLRRRGIDLALYNFPRATANHLGSQNNARLFQDPDLPAEVDRVLLQLRQRVGTEGRVFLILVTDGVNDGLFEFIEKSPGVWDPVDHGPDRPHRLHRLAGTHSEMMFFSFRLRE